ncbi:hypothetical protein HOY82DRAFT_637642 [Tuber indicum]|nr:hypothetical protein HOY82DRAFT_637642 [Tuber indicum]
MRFVAPTIAIAFLAAFVAGQSKIGDGQVQGPELSAECPHMVLHPRVSNKKLANEAEQVITPTPCPHMVIKPTPCPHMVLKPSASPIKSSNEVEQTIAPTPCPKVVPSAPPKVPKPTPSAGAPCPPIPFEGGALARKYPVGGAVAIWVQELRAADGQKNAGRRKYFVDWGFGGVSAMYQQSRRGRRGDMGARGKGMEERDVRRDC